MFPFPCLWCSLVFFLCLHYFRLCLLRNFLFNIRCLYFVLPFWDVCFGGTKVLLLCIFPFSTLLILPFSKYKVFACVSLVGHHLHKGQSHHHLNGQRQQPPKERRQGQPPAATKKAKAATATKKVLSPPLTFGVVLFSLSFHGKVVVPLPPPFGSCAPPVPSLLASGSASLLGKGNPNPKKEAKRSKEGPKRKASQTQEGGPAQDGRLTQTPSFLWVVFPHSLVRWCCFSSSCFQLAFLLLPSWSWGCPPRPPRGEEKKGNGSTTQKEEGQKQHPQEGSGIRAPQEEREREREHQNT